MARVEEPAEQLPRESVTSQSVSQDRLDDDRCLFRDHLADNRRSSFRPARTAFGVAADPSAEGHLVAFLLTYRKPEACWSAAQPSRDGSHTGAQGRPSRLAGCSPGPKNLEAAVLSLQGPFSAGLFPGLTCDRSTKSAPMRPPIPSVSPFPSFATRPTLMYRAPSFIEELGTIWRWWRGVRLTQRERQLQEARVERLAAEMDEATEPEAAIPSLVERLGQPVAGEGKRSRFSRLSLRSSRPSWR